MAARSCHTDDICATVSPPSHVLLPGLDTGSAFILGIMPSNAHRPVNILSAKDGNLAKRRRNGSIKVEVLKGRGMPFFFIDECKNRRVFLDPFVCYWSFITSGRGDALCAGWSLFASADDCVVSSDAALGFVCL